MAAQTFLSAYRKLNPEQKKAVDSVEGAVMVIAGPGTGKTQILTLRIANILRKTDTPPDAILALTFTESAVFSMRRRLVEILGPDAYRVRISTFHGFANELIARFPDSFPRIIGSRALPEVERVALMQELIAAAPLTHLRPFGDSFYYLKDILNKLGELKRENISPKEYQKLLREREDAFAALPDLYNEKGAYAGQMKTKYVTLRKRLEKDRELLGLYETYQEELRARKLYDYEDMILEAIGAMEADKELLMTLQEEHQYLLADEHQDANMSQSRLLELLASFHENPNLFIVGDEKQAIFRFQGASLQNFLYFKNKFPQAILITLRNNYRSAQNILDSAHALMGHAAPGLQRAPLLAAGEKGLGTIEFAALPTLAAERAYIARAVRALIDEGADPAEIAVLYRVNGDADSLAEALEREEVPVVVGSNQNILADVDIRRFLALVRALAFFGAQEQLVPALHLSFLELPERDVARVLALSRGKDLYDILADTAALRRAKVKNPRLFTGLSRKLTSWKSALHNKGLLAGLEIVARESGFVRALVSSAQAYEKLGLVAALFEAGEELVRAKRDATPADFIEHLQLMEDYHLALKAPRQAAGRKAVQLMTAHGAKGREFEHVFVAHVYDGKWGNRREHRHFSPVLPQGEDDTALEDERRLFYVALTRAKRSLLLTYPEVSDTGALLLPASFLEELDKSLITVLDTRAFADRFSSAAARFTALRAPAQLDADLVRSLFAEQGLSVTALNNYLECPWRYFYSNLLRVPQAPDKHLLFGTAVHTALKEFFDVWKTGEDIGSAGLCARFLREVEELPLPPKDIAELTTRGVEALTGFYAARRDEFRPGVAELSIVTFIPTDIAGLPRLRLRGTLDRVEFIGSGRAVVYDYKTGKPKSRKDIEGTPEKWGNYKRQLLFYAVLLQHYDRGARTMERGTIEFIQPDEKSRYHSHDIVPTEEALRQLHTEIARVAGEIMSLSFVGRRCKDAACPYCAMRDLPGLIEATAARPSLLQKKPKRRPSPKRAAARALRR